MPHLIMTLLVTVSIMVIGTGLATAETVDPFEEARAKAASGDIQGALVDYQALTREMPESFEAFARLGGMQLLSQRYNDAIQSFQQAISLGDQTARSFIGMGMAYLHLNQLGPARAAFVEAQNRGTDKPDDIADIIAWIDARKGGSTPGR